jgi:predicted dienelactone hydrolase
MPTTPFSAAPAVPIRRFASTLLTTLLVLVTTSAGHAAATAGSCASAEQKAAGKTAAAQLGCHAKATQKGEPVDALCLSKAADKLSATALKQDGAGGCLLPGFGGDLVALAASLTTDVVGATPPGSVAKCAAAKQKNAGKTAAAKLGCWAKATKAGGAVDPACLDKAQAKLVAAFAKEESKAPGCNAFGVVGAIGPRIDAFVASVVNGTPAVTPAARCCEHAGNGYCADVPGADALDTCTNSLGGELSGPALVCDGATAGCVEKRAPTTTGCCDSYVLPGPEPVSGRCFEGPGAATQCGLIFGTYHDAAKCLPSGGCAPADEPGATGPWGVGHRQLVSVDASRTNGLRCMGGSKVGRACTTDANCPSSTCSVGRYLPLEVWYPVDAPDAYGPFTGYSLQNIVTLPSELAHENAAVSAGGARPLVVFSHGSGGIAIQSLRLMERLASHGFVVVAPNHTGNTTADGSAVPPTSVSPAQALLDRVPDVTFVITHMASLAAAPADPFFGRIDASNVGVAGHSLGGFTALAVKSGYSGNLPDARVKAIMPIAPSASALTDPELTSITVPTLFMTGTLDPLLADEVRAAGLIQSSPFNYRADVVGAIHTHFANICDIANALIGAGFLPGQWPSIGAGALVAPYNDTCIPPAFPIAEATRLQNLYATAFFRRHLLGQTVYDPYLTTTYATTNEPNIDFIVTP